MTASPPHTEAAQRAHQRISELDPRVTRLEELVGKGTRLNIAAAIAGYDDTEIRQILSLQEKDQLDDSAVVTAMITSIATLRSDVRTIIDVTADTRGMANAHERTLYGPNRDDSLNEQVSSTGLVTMVSSLAQDVQQQQQVTEQVVQSTRTSPAQLVIAAIVGLVAGIFWHAHDFGSTGTLKNGKVLSADVQPHLWDNIWASVFFGLIVGALVLIVLSFGKNNSITTTSTTQSNDNGSRESFFHRRRRTTEQDAPSDPPASTPSAPAPASQPTQTLQAAHQ